MVRFFAVFMAFYLFMPQLGMAEEDKFVFPFIFEIRTAMIDKPAAIYQCPSDTCAIRKTISTFCYVKYFYKIFDDERDYGDWVRIHGYGCWEEGKRYNRELSFYGYIKKEIALYPVIDIDVAGLWGISPTKVIVPFEYRDCLKGHCPVLFNSEKQSLSSYIGDKDCSISVTSSKFFDIYNDGWMPVDSSCNNIQTHSIPSGQHSTVKIIHEAIRLIK